MEVAVYKKEYVDKNTPFSGASLFSTVGRLVSTDLTIGDSCGKRQNEICKADPFCEDTTKSIKITGVPSNVVASTDFGAGFRTVSETWTIPVNLNGYPSPLVMPVPNAKSRLSDTTFNNGSNFMFNTGSVYPKGDYTILAYVYETCGSGKVYTPIRKDIKVVCPSSVDEWKRISPETFTSNQENAQLKASEESQIYSLNSIAYRDQINELCVKPEILEVCKDRAGNAGIWAQISGSEVKECLSEQNLQDLLTTLGLKQMSIDANQLKSLDYDSAQPYLCSPLAPNVCPSNSNCVTMKDLETNGILLPGQVEKGFLDNPTFKAGLIGAGVGCAGGLLAKASAGVLGNLPAVAGATPATLVITASSKFLYKALPGISTTCLLGGAAGAASGVVVQKLTSGIINWFTHLETNPKETLGYCVDKGTEKPSVTSSIAQYLGTDEATLKFWAYAILGFLAFGWLYKTFIKK